MEMDWILLIINYVPLPIFLFYRIGGVDTLYFRCNIGFCSNSALRENGISKCEDVRFLLLIQMSRFVHIYWMSVCYLFLFSIVVNVFHQFDLYLFNYLLLLLLHLLLLLVRRLIIVIRVVMFL